MGDERDLKVNIRSKPVILRCNDRYLEHLSPEGSISLRCKPKSPRDFKVLHRYVLAAEYIGCDGSPRIEIRLLSRVGRRGKRSLITWLGYVEKGDEAQAPLWIDKVLQKAYENVTRYRRLKVLVNPFGGSGRACKRWSKVQPILGQCYCQLDVHETQYHAEAEEIAQELDIDAYDGIVCVSGDGLVHEVLNGFAKRSDGRKALRKITIGVIPAGTGNALAVNLFGPNSSTDLTESAIALVKGKPNKMTLCTITQPGKPPRITFLSQAYGILAEADIGSESMRWMGEMRFTVKFLTELIAGRKYEYELYAKPFGCSQVVDAKGRSKVLSELQHDSRCSDDVDISKEGTDDAESWAIEMPRLQFGTVDDPLGDDWVDASGQAWSIYSGTQKWISNDVQQFPFSLPDGLIDMTIAKPTTSRWTILADIPMATKGEHVLGDHYVYMKVEAYRFIPKGKVGKERQPFISIDGESVAHAPFQVESLGLLARVFALNDES